MQEKPGKSVVIFPDFILSSNLFSTFAKPVEVLPQFLNVYAR